MKNLKIIYLALGAFLFLYFLSQTSVESLWLQIKKVSWGIIPIIFTYFIGFCCDALLWNLTLKKKINYSLKWLFHIWKVKMVGEAFNVVTPLATLGGEPIKIFILKKISKIPYKEGGSAFILTKTIVMISLILFLTTGLVIILKADLLPESYNTYITSGLVIFAILIALLYLSQRFKLFSLLGKNLKKITIKKRINRFLRYIEDVEERLTTFYSEKESRFLTAVILGLSNWAIGVVELYFIMFFLGHPITIAEAWMIESFVQIVKAATFFIPGSLGALEGAFMFIIGLITGNNILGLSAALVRRFREIVWIAWGMMIGNQFSITLSNMKQRIKGVKI